MLRLEHQPIIEGNGVGFGGDTCHGESENSKQFVHHNLQLEGSLRRMLEAVKVVNSSSSHLHTDILGSYISQPTKCYLARTPVHNSIRNMTGWWPCTSECLEYQKLLEVTASFLRYIHWGMIGSMCMGPPPDLIRVHSITSCSFIKAWGTVAKVATDGIQNQKCWSTCTDQGS